MRVPRKIKKAMKFYKRYIQQMPSGLLVIPYEEFVVKGRYTKWKQKGINKVKRTSWNKYL